MAWDVETNHYMQLAMVTLWGSVDAAERGRALDALLARLEPGREYRVLVDMIAARPTHDALDETAAFTRRLVAEADRRGLRVAYLCPTGSRAQALVDSLADVAGFAFRRFEEGSEAMDWLLAPAPRIGQLPPVERQVPPQPAAARVRTRRRWFG